MRVHDGRVSWAETFDAELTDIFTVQDRIAEDVARQVMPTLARERLDRLAKRHTGNLDAYQLYLKGRFFWKDRSEPDLRKAIVFFERALETDPGYALAYAGLAQCWLVLAVGGFGPPGESAQALLTAASQALELDDSLSDAHLSLASYRLITWDWHGAEEAFRRAIQLNPSNPTARIWYGLFLVANGHLEEGLVQRQRAVELDPVGLQANASLADSYLRVGKIKLEPCLRSWRRVHENNMFPPSTVYPCIQGSATKSERSIGLKRPIERGRPGWLGSGALSRSSPSVPTRGFRTWWRG